MPKTIKEFQLNQSTGEVSVEYSDDSTSKFNAADMVTAQTDPITGRIVNSTGGKSVIADTLHIGLIKAQGDADAAKSVSIQQAAYSDNATFVETWVNLNNWAVGGANGVQVSGGYLYGGSNPLGSTSGLNKGISITTGVDSLRAVIPITLLSGANTGGLLVGVTSDAAGASPTANGGKARGIYFAGNGVVSKFDQGATTQIDAVWAAGQYIVTVVIDESYLTVTARKTDGSKEYRARWTHAGFDAKNIYLMNSDTRALSGSFVGSVGVKKSLTTLTPRAGVEGVGHTVIWSGEANQNYRLAIPKGYDSRIPSPLVICFHGGGSNELTWAGGGDSNYPKIANALLDAGFVVLSVGYIATNWGWGAPASIAAYKAAYDWVKTRIAFSSVSVFANSMGGIESLNALSKGLIPGVCAWVGTAPAYSLDAMYTYPDFTAGIKSVYGIASDGSDYANKTAGYNPANNPPNIYGGIPMMILHASDDTVVQASQNGFALASAVTGVAREVVSVQGITGGHTFDVTPYLNQITAFIKQYAS